MGQEKSQCLSDGVPERLNRPLLEREEAMGTGWGGGASGSWKRQEPPQRPPGENVAPLTSSCWPLETRLGHLAYRTVT